MGYRMSEILLAFRYLRKISPLLSPCQQTLISKRVLYHGTEHPTPEGVPLRSGPLSLLYEEGDLQYIKWGEQVVIRRVYVAVRDSIWCTIGARLTNVKLQADEDSFHITYDAENVKEAIDFAWQAEISGTSSGTITFRMKGIARSNFWRNRIGFCVLHPMRECAGTKCVVRHGDGTFLESAFPQTLSPHAPFSEMKSIAHEVSPGLWAKVQFEGDLFEMEDQRNWTDASFKTFCTPLHLPYPVEVEAGTPVEQSITLHLLEQGQLLEKERRAKDSKLLKNGSREKNAFSSKSPVPRPHFSATSRQSQRTTITIDPSEGQKVATVGLGMASHGQPLSDRELDRLSQLQLAHLRVDLRLSQPDWRAELERAVTDASRLNCRTKGTGLEVALFLSNEAKQELLGLLAALGEMARNNSAPRIVRWLIFHVEQDSTEERWIVLARQSLATYDASIPVGSGTNLHFTQLNRERPPLSLVDTVCYSITPQAHAFDLRSLVETLEAQGSTVENARRLAGRAALAVTPITLRPRFNPGLGADPEVAPGELPHSVDPRQSSLFGAAWTLGSLKYLNESGARSVTYYETTGWRGIMETESGSPLPEKFRSLPETVFPLYHVLADFGEFSEGQVIPCRSCDPLRVEAMVLTKEGPQEKTTRVMLGNMTAEPQEVVIEVPAPRAELKILDETNVLEAIESCEAFRAREGQRLKVTNNRIRLELRPFAVARLDWS